MKQDATILVVDDEEMARKLLHKILTDEGHVVRLARSGNGALEILAREHVDLVITDVKMPGMDGFELLRTVKNDYPDTGTIVMTGFGDAYTVRDALLLGADEYITKPFNSFELMMVVERASWRIQSSRSREESQSS